MGNCIICKKKLKIFEGYKDSDGEYCDECFLKKKKNKEDKSGISKIKKGIKISGVSRSTKILDAEKIIITPKGRDRFTNLDDKHSLQRLLEDKEISERCKILFNYNSKSDLFFNHSLFSKQILFEVLETTPKGRLKITEETIIEIKNRPLDEFDIPDDKIIDIINPPDTKNLIEVKNIEQIIKLAKAGFLVNKFENQKEIIFLVDIYYLKKTKL
ncbi:MAG: hypothetical protein WC260_02460 [Candidatus Pacearchaeota archaeon]